MALFKNEKTQQEGNKSMDLTKVITTAIRLPGVKVSRNDFLKEQFKDFSPAEVEVILQKGPVEAGCPRALLERKAGKLIKERTAISTGASFVAGLPGGLAMAATIPADMLQFYGVALRMAQELVYLYGEKDIWCDGVPDPDYVTNQLLLYCGVMLGASGAAQAVRMMSAALAKQALKRIPRIALTKTFYYPVIKSTLRFFGVSLTKSTFAKGISKALPVVGGVVSGGITLASMLPMGTRLKKVLDEAHYSYTKADFEADWRDISKMQEVELERSGEEEVLRMVQEPPMGDRSTVGMNKETDKISKDEIYVKLKRAKQLLDAGMITEEEYSVIRLGFISQL